MSVALRPYPEYRESGVEWLGEIPRHWECLPNRTLFSVIDDRNHVAEPLLSVTIGRGVIRQSELLTNSSKKDSSNENKANYKLVRYGDIAYNKMRAWQGAIGVSEYQGIVSPAYIVVRPRGRQNSHYYHHLLRTPAFATEAERWSYGITSDQWSLREGEFKQIYCTFPPKAEQDAIVAFLGHFDRRINRLIRAKRRQIELLNEQKQAIIHQAVTRGLDPNARLKPSGVPWLGDMPEHWEVLPARYLFRAVTRRDTRVDDVKLSVTQRLGLVPTEEMDENSTQAASFERFQVCHPGDLVLNKYKAHLGVFWSSQQRGLITPNYTVFRPIRSLSTKYFELLFHTRSYRDAFSMTVYGVTEGMSPLYTQDFYQIAAISPPLVEQEEIVRRVGDLVATQDSAIVQIGREIDLLREYRTRLIADVVTGKLDVRGVALPAEDEPTDAADEGELKADEAADAEGDEDELSAD